MHTNDTLNYLNFLINVAEFLGSDFEIQESKLGGLGDALTDDIASDWDWDYLVFFVNELVSKKNISQELEKKFILIDKNFLEVSCGEKYFNPDIWTLNSLKDDPFWDNQRKLAREILNELKTAKKKYF